MFPLKVEGERERLGKPWSHPWVPFVDYVYSVEKGSCGPFIMVFTTCRSLLVVFWKRRRWRPDGHPWGISLGFCKRATALIN